MTYHQILQRLVGAAFVLGGSLTAVAAVIYILGINVNPGTMGWGSSTEGFIGFYAYLALAVAFIELSRRLGKFKPKLAAVTTVTSLVGFAGGGVMNMVYRVMIPDLAAAGMTTEMMDRVNENMMSGAMSAEFLLLIFMGPLAPLSSLMIGVGFLLAGRFRWQATLLILGGVMFPLGELFLLGMMFYVGATILWAIVLVPMGIKMIVDERPAGLPQGQASI